MRAEMFDTLVFLWHKNYRDLVGHEIPLSWRARQTAPSSDEGLGQRYVANRSGTRFRYFPAVGQQLGQYTTHPRIASLPFSSTRTRIPSVSETPTKRRPSFVSSSITAPINFDCLLCFGHAKQLWS